MRRILPRLCIVSKSIFGRVMTVMIMTVMIMTVMIMIVTVIMAMTMIVTKRRTAGMLMRQIGKVAETVKTGDAEPNQAQ